MLVERTLELAPPLVLAGAFPLSVVAVRGFRGAPSGAVLELTAEPLSALGTWQFARPFVRLRAGDAETATVGNTGGFESVEDD